MAHLRCDFFSDVLGLSSSMTVLLPGVIGDEPPPVLYLLHGFSDDDTAWLRRTSIQRYVSPLGLAVVMPQVHRSFYADEVYGNKYWTFLSEELPALVSTFFTVSTRREDTFVAGNSMGGYGAFKWALRQPDRFAAAASISGSLGMATRERCGNPKKELFDRIFGEGPIEGTDNDLIHLLDTFDHHAHTLPQLNMSCGTEDNLIQENEKFLASAREKGVQLKAHFGPGEHDWDYWDLRIKEVLDWLPLQSRSTGK